MTNEEFFLACLVDSVVKDNRKYAFQELQKIKDLNMFMQPIDVRVPGKWIWDSCALILYSKSDEELLPYLDGMFKWLQDTNWPGALIIIKRLREFPKDLIKNKYEEAKEKAKQENDEIWFENLIELYKDEPLQNKAIKQAFNQAKETIE